MKDANHSPEQDLTLSPSERMGDRMATSLSGSRKTRSTVKSLASIVLGFELFVVFLIGLTVFGLEAVEPAELGIFGGLGLCLLIVLALGLMRFGAVGVVIGHAVQVLLFLTGIILPAVVFVAVVFSALWVFCLIKGAQIDKERQNRLESYAEGDFSEGERDPNEQ